MSAKFDSISDITAENENWIIMAKVIRLWLVSDLTKSKIPFSMEMVLLDDKGDRIHASVRRTLIYKFEKLLKEGSIYTFQHFGVGCNGGCYRTSHHTYKINFQFTTKVDKSANASIAASVYAFVPISEISRGCHDPDYLADVIGCLTGVGTEREYEKNGRRSKLNVIALEADGIQCTLFGNYVDQLNLFLAAGEVDNVVVLLQFAKVKEFQDKMHLQNCIDCTKLIFNPVCEEAVQLRQRMAEINQASPTQGISRISDAVTVGQADEFLENTPRSTIDGLKNCKEEGTFVVFGTVKHIINNDDWWYTACVCNKKVYPDSKMYFCEKCNKHVMKVVPRYRIKVRVIDSTDSATFVIWDRDAALLFNKSCEDMLEFNDKTDGERVYPKELSELVEKSLLFKVEFQTACSSKFEQSFRVKRICNDPSVINKFIEGAENSVGNVKDSIILPSCIDLAEDLMPKFSSAVVDLESQTDEMDGANLPKHSQENYPLKRDLITDKGKAVVSEPKVAGTADIEIPLKLLKKKIKKEQI